VVDKVDAANFQVATDEEKKKEELVITSYLRGLQFECFCRERR